MIDLTTLTEREAALYDAGFQAGLAAANATSQQLEVTMATAGLEAKLALPIEELNFGVRLYNACKREGIHTVGDLVDYTEADLLDIRQLGKGSRDTVRATLTTLGLALKQEEATTAAEG